MTVAAFRPDDERLADAVELIESLGATPVPDPMLAVEPTGDTPRSDADFVVLTSKTGVELASGERGGEGAAPAERWDPGDATVCAIGEPTADILRETGYEVDLVPEEFSSSGLVDALAEDVDGARVEVARSDHGSEVLTDGLEDAGAYVHETILYRLVRPDGAGESAELAAEGDLDAALFTSSLTVEHFLDAAADRGVREDAVAGLAAATVGVIGEPTRETAESLGIDVDVVPERADFEELACATIEDGAPTYTE
ncbi:uroporphyrinogen-III synthase [Natronoarchaeum philippinense]|uniref:Uroporphyrinogen-III synthase n=1 Tax=Natronoarchaeum philippinense TaxID=558529 RepID=A0A285PCX1_NATPI|nr:uroporphyrinogen-III synthase [Natronoarchaeum philippinense]SNZ17701.1 uroporphyrinogen-III synthase [Natronoarchaeum philippinense]